MEYAMMPTMRTTLTLDDEVFTRLKEKAHQANISFKQVVNETLQRGLATEETPQSVRRYQLEPSSLGGTLLGIDLDKALVLADGLEDQAITRKLEARK
jgi:hypothetical protein